MRLVTILAAAGLGYAAYSLLMNPPDRRSRRDDRLRDPYASGAGDGGFVRNAGSAEAARLSSEWDEVDEASDESFPASDPPARY